MKREEIEKASKKYANENAYIPSDGYAENNMIEMKESFAEAFKDGVEWRINSVWHDASEKPDMSKEIIVIYPDKSCRVFRPNGVWETLIEVDKFIRWAYVEDLLPNMED